MKFDVNLYFKRFQSPLDFYDRRDEIVMTIYSTNRYSYKNDRKMNIDFGSDIALMKNTCLSIEILLINKYA